jgi:hypothetical protein
LASFFAERAMSESPRIIKKYPNRRLYDTANSGYITLADVKQMVLDDLKLPGHRREVGRRPHAHHPAADHPRGGSGGMPMFSSEMLAQMIRFYGSAQQTVMGQYIEQNVKAFLAIQKKLQDQAKQIYGDKMMITPGPVEAVHADAGARHAGDARQLPGAEREALHGHAAAHAGPDARHLRGLPVSPISLLRSKTRRTTPTSADAS